jgi:tyrosyl-tRNA synthetase
MDNKQSILKQNIAEIIDEKSLSKKLNGKQKLRVKLGFDPTSPDIHLGHIITLDKLRQFQKLGHKIIFLIGDYTARIGDPSGKSKTRPMLSEKEIETNAKNYFDQVGKILNVDQAEIRRNSEWYKDIKFSQIIEIVSNFSLSRIIERDDFEKRIKSGGDVRYHEGLYPIMQAYDSVMLKADVEIGGTDQKFNLLAGRNLQKKMGQKPQDIITVPLLIGIDGKKKMSKSLGNYIGVTEEPNNLFGKIMSIPDFLIFDYFKYLTELQNVEIEEMKRGVELGENPRDAKERLAKEIVGRFFGNPEAEKAALEFKRVFREKKMPEQMPEKKMKKGVCEDLPQMLSDLEMAKSKSEARRLILSGAVKIDGAKIEDIKAPVCVHDGMVVQIGKYKFFRIKGE